MAKLVKVFALTKHGWKGKGKENGFMLVFSELLVEIGGLMGVKGGTYCEHGSKFSNPSFLADLMKILKEMVVETLEGMLIELL